MLEMMQSDNSKTLTTGPNTRFVAHTSVKDWGYIHTVSSDHSYLNNGLRENLDAVGLACTGTGVEVVDEHDNDTLHEGTLFPATGATFNSFIERESGIFIAAMNFGPKASVEEAKKPDTLLPDLRHWSDIDFLQWTDSAP